MDENRTITVIRQEWEVVEGGRVKGRLASLHFQEGDLVAFLAAMEQIRSARSDNAEYRRPYGRPTTIQATWKMYHAIVMEQYGVWEYPGGLYRGW